MSSLSRDNSPSKEDNENLYRSKKDEEALKKQKKAEKAAKKAEKEGSKQKPASTSIAATKPRVSNAAAKASTSASVKNPIPRTKKAKAALDVTIQQLAPDEISQNVQGSVANANLFAVPVSSEVISKMPKTISANFVNLQKSAVAADTSDSDDEDYLSRKDKQLVPCCCWSQAETISGILNCLYFEVFDCI